MKKINNIVVIILFILFIFGIFFANLISKDIEISVSERRKLAQFPKITVENLLNGKNIKDFENYTVDQFIVRDNWKNLKSIWSINIFRQKDDNKIFEKDGALYKMEYPLNKSNVLKNAEKMQNIYNKYLDGMNVYYSVIPDKNYYLKNDDHLVMDYSEVEKILSNNLKDFKYINIFKKLKLDDYYKTDIHWKQENLKEVANEISLQMNNISISDIDYQKENVGKFYGTYYGQISSNVEADEMYILTNETIENCTTYNYETRENLKIYDKKETKDKYDIYLSGPTPLIEINNPSSKQDKEMLIFRDSFGSSLAPLLVENYKKITLIDLRYISSDLLGKFVEFKNQDVLFIYSGLILNQNVMK